MRLDWLIRAGVLALLLAASGCVSFEEQTLSMRYDRDTDELRVFQVYHGIHTTTEGEPTDTELAELDQVLEGEQTFFFSNWLFAVKRDDMIASLAERMRMHPADFRETLDAERKPDGTDLTMIYAYMLANLQIENGAVYRDAEGRLCATQQVTLRHAATVVELINTQVLPALLEARALDGDFTPATLAAMKAAIAGGHRVLELQEGGLVVRIPMSRHDFMATRQEVATRLLQKLGESEDLPHTVASDVLPVLQVMAQDVQLYHHDGMAILELGSPAARTFRLTQTTGKSIPSDLLPALAERGITVHTDFDVAAARATFLGAE